MDQAIVDIVLGLVLLYITLALLAMKVQEGLQGGLFKRRTGNLHTLLFEALGRDSTMKDRVLGNPLIAGLFKGTKAESGVRSSGPSAVPPPLFARALLMELNGGEHPSLRFGTPQSFIESLSGQPNLPAAFFSVKALVPSRESDWPALEAAVAQWFNDVGDRAEGWYKRESTRWSFIVAFGLAVLLNVDSFHIASSLSVDPEARGGLAGLAERVQALREQETASTSGAKPGIPANTTALAPSLEQQVSTAFDNAIDSISRAYFRDKKGKFQAFKVNPAYLSANCTDIQTVLPKGPSPNEQSAEFWLRALPALKAALGESAIEDALVARAKRQRVLHCVNSLIGLLPVAAARAQTSDESTAALVNEAKKDLTFVANGLESLTRRDRTVTAFTKLYEDDPEGFRTCYNAGPTSRAAFEDCLTQLRVQSTRLPFGWLAHNLRKQFCRVRELKLDEEPAPANACTWDQAAPFDQPGNPLGIGRLVLEHTDPLSAWGAWLVGILVTTLFVSLGAPFWFDVLSKVTRVRVSGQVREDGIAPPAKPADGDGKPAARGTSPAADAPPPFSDARNRFEDSLVVSDIVRLQQTLNVAATGRLDGPTRRGVAAFCRDHMLAVAEELDAMLYDRIVGRSPTGSPVRRAAPLEVGTSDPRANALVNALEQQLDFAGRSTGTVNTWDADSRALAVLYRYKVDAQAQRDLRQVFDLARTDPRQLDQVSDPLAAAILGAPGTTVPVRPREPAPWLDWAIGELGQIEKGGTTPQTSNPRICEYLDAALPGASQGGDGTPWCGGFVAWVIERFNGECARRGAPFIALAAPPAPAPGVSALTASHWSTWGVARGANPAAAVAAIKIGDVVVVATNAARTSFHVGFAFELARNAAGSVTSVQLLGGNQADGSRVCLSRFAVNDILAVQAG